MRVPFLDIKSQYQEVKPALDQAVFEILESGAYVMGKWNAQLEQRLAERHGVKHGIAVNSGTDALRIMMQAGGIGPGDEVITTAFTFVATVETIVQLGAIPVFVDVEEETYNIDPDLIEAAITPRTKAIMPIHLFGQLANVRAIKEIAERHGLTVFEDSAQVIHGHHEGVFTGNWGIAAGISFYVTKNLGAAGDGGLILTNDDGVAERSRSLRIHGMGKERYYYDSIGYTSRMAELQAAVLCHKLDRLDAWNARRVEIAHILLDRIDGDAVGMPVTSPGNNHTWHQFTIRAANRDALMAGLKEAGIDSGIYYPVPLHLHDPYRQFGSGRGSLPVTERLGETVLSLPVHQNLSDEQAAYVAEQVNRLAAAPAVAR